MDLFWPKPLPNRWLLGQVSGVAVDRRDQVWIIQRPRTLTEDERGAPPHPPRSECCVPAPPVMEFGGDGNLLQAWGGPAPSYDWPASEHGIHVDGQDKVWLAGNGEKDNQVLMPHLHCGGGQRQAGAEVRLPGRVSGRAMSGDPVDDRPPPAAATVVDERTHTRRRHL